MQPIISEKIQMNEDGQVTIPYSILKLYGIRTIDVEIQLIPDGTIQLIPQLPFPKSFYMESSQEILDGAARGYSDSIEKKICIGAGNQRPIEGKNYLKGILPVFLLNFL